ncbi:pyridoxamine 5'-phosphate oxidase [Rhodocytophaga rosea]|uniref:Pyridoxine/pyridoxamine 5'-phosphate oxidase n=1 Tax=Rhodocytophaga rosea TaxID=2704465 RepID=A0A6C0GC61_9BACT|nr:pyridoxamine 5'-phosphate oxidase [Rhodocytophaga rosea]QHT65412.1 pyridoxamine 5'-phosphate oxidase [Rhodocytophaga rosea]
MNSTSSLADIRNEYTRQELDFDKTAADPFSQFRQWFDEALQSKVPEPNAMHLCTVSANGRPSGRIVLLKGMETQGFVFYTNYESRKGKEMAQNTWVSLTFFWPELERQVRIEGKVTLTSAAQSDEYYHSRPKGSQLGAWASPQSQVIPTRAILEENLTSLEEKFKAMPEIPRPPHWGGYCVLPDAIEFWQGRQSRLHDRINYVKQPDGSWHKQRLAP